MNFKLIKRILLIILIIPLFAFTISINGDSGKEDLYINGSRITLKNGTGVKINKEYELKGQEFRACWVSSLVGDMQGFSTIEGYKAQIISILDHMAKQNLNTIIFHIRIKNDALYESEYNKWSSYYDTNPTWDGLPWVIEECHRRGIEFHAWMNPYRVSTGATSDLATLAKNFLPNNPASNPKNLLSCSSCVILDPGIPEVQDFLVTTCMEVVEKYDVDAIHFDDYFYASGCDDTETYQKYNTTGLSVANFRRKAVTDFIKKLSTKLRKFNEDTNRRVQLGISPTGVYANGAGDVSFDSAGNVHSSGSRTSGYSHSGAPLYADTLDWINNEWIDYICPQTYHAITNGAVPFCEITNWWNQVMARTNVNLYVSMGLYMRGGSGNASWSYNDLEPYHQIMYMNTLENCRGMSVYSYSALSSLNSSTVKNVWATPVIPPEVRTMERIIPSDVDSLSVKKTSFGSVLEFPKNDSKFYVIYRSETPITFSPDEVIDVIGDISVDGIISYPDETPDKHYYYGVRTLSNSNTLSSGVTTDNKDKDLDLKAKLNYPENFKVSDNILNGEEITITWDKILYQFDSNVKYELNYSFDEGSIYSSIVENYRGRLKANIKIPNGAKVLKIKLTSYTNTSMSTKEEVYNISPSLGHIYNFGVLDSSYSGCDTVFYFNKIDGSNSDYEYTLEYSYDGFNFDKLKTIKATDSFNQEIKASIVPYQNFTYYRVKASYNNSYGYSDIISFNLIEHLNTNTSVYVNNEELKDYYILDEGEKIDIKISSIPQASYSIQYSKDGSSWMNITTLDNRVVREEKDGNYHIVINIGYQYFKVSLRVYALIGGKEAVLVDIDIYTKLSFLYSDEVLEYMFDENHEIIDNMNLYK